MLAILRNLCASSDYNDRGYIYIVEGKLNTFAWRQEN